MSCSSSGSPLLSRPLAEENKLAGGGRQVDAASMFDAYAHPTISTLALDWGQDGGRKWGRVRKSWSDNQGESLLKVGYKWRKLYIRSC